MSYQHLSDKLLATLEFGAVQLRSVIREFKIQRNCRDENVKKTISLISKTTTMHMHQILLYVSSPVVVRLRREHAKFCVLWRT